MSKTSTSLLSTNSRNSWMNDSDMEVDEELPNLSLNIERDKFEKLSKKDVKVQEVINELIHTEQKHVRNLKIMKNHFYIPIKLEILLTDDERNLLFPNLDEILDLHSTFNNKLKKLRKENPIVPVNQLVDVIQDQFQGETGYRFQTACATFCQNQSEAMKFLQVKSKLATDKFTSFLAKSENDVICRKLHLKDFLPTEVQRLVKYRLLFQELTKNTADEENKKRLVDCIDASSKISLHVNKAVTECENKKRVIEIQNKLDTKEFDQYCVRSPVLSPYKNLQLTSRKLVYEGELEWKLSNLKLMALLFEDILVFLETVRHESSNDEKRRYLLRPLIYIIGKSKQMFTPVIPLTCINSFRSMHDKRSFHLVAIIEDGAKLTKHSTISSSSSSSSSKPIQAQMLFILIAKSGDERNKWTTHLQELTGKMMQTVGNDLQTSNVQDLTNKPTSLTNTISATNLLSNYTPNSIKNSNSVSSSALLSNKSIELSNETKPANDSCLSAQLEKNTADILSLLKSRHELLIQIRSDSAKNSELSLFDNNESTNSKVLISSSIGLLNTMTANLLGSSESMSNSQHANSIQIIVKLEEYLNKLNRNLNESSAKLPDLKSTMSTSITKKQPSIGSSLSRVSRDFSNNLTDSVADAVSTTTTSELTADLSEDEQINYYDEYDYNSSNDNIYDAEKLENGTSTVNQPSVLRRFSDSSNKTLCVLTPSVGKVHVQKSMNVDADDEEEDLLYRKKIDVNNDKFSRKNSIVNSQNEYLDGVSAKNKLTCSQSSSDLNETTKKQTSLKYSDTFDGGSEVRKSFRSSNDIFKSMAKEPKPLNTLINSPSKTSNLVAAISSFQSESPKIVKANQIPPAEDLNDSSDDEVKDYLTFKDNFDEISHV
jgi:Rho guanine nucleotide exchange factor 12